MTHTYDAIWLSPSGKEHEVRVLDYFSNHGIRMDPTCWIQHKSGYCREVDASEVTEQ